MIDTAGQEIDTNDPVYGCTGCSTTAGRGSCNEHGISTSFGKIIDCDGEDLEISRMISRHNYGSLL